MLMNSKYINKRFIIISAIVGLIIPFLVGFGIADNSPIPHFLSYIIWQVPGIISATILGGGIGNSFLGPAGIFVWAGISSLYFVVIFSLIRAGVIFCMDLFKKQTP